MSESKKRPHAGNGEGSFYFIKSKNLWCYRITIGAGPDGKPLRKAFYDQDKKKARQKGIEAQVRQAHGQASVNSDVLFSTFADQWLDTYKTDLAPSTRATYKSLIDNQIKPAIGKNKLKDITPMRVQKMIADALAAGASKSVIKKMKTFTNAILEVAIDNDLIYKNPARKIKLPKMDKLKTVRDAFTPEEENAIIDFAPLYDAHRTATKPYNTGWAVIILLKTGLRLGELLALRWDDITDSGIKVHQVVSLDKDRVPYIKKTPKTVNSVRTLPVHPLVKYALENLPQEHELIFCTNTGGVMDPRNFQRSYKLYFDTLEDVNFKPITGTEVKVKYRSPHLCRHTFATDLNRAGVDPKTIAYLLGHSTIEMSFDFYIDADMQKAAKAIDLLVF